MMLTLILILLTWYTTKYYYTRSLKLSMPTLDPDMGNIKCSGCSQTIYTHKDNFRVPYYCIACG